MIEAAEELRFAFGANWQSFLRCVDTERVAEAERSLLKNLEADDLRGATFLDVGCGSGLFSLASRRLGARVLSFDYDARSVACALELRRRFGLGEADWKIERGSVLDQDYLERLGSFDIVYSWGVLHHTGAMWQALANVSRLVKPGGSLFISIYNDQGMWSRIWWHLKRVYNMLPAPLRPIYAVLIMAPRELLTILSYTLQWQLAAYFRRWQTYKTSRGMSRLHDLVDWIGGFPFEVAKPEQVFDFYRSRGFELQRMTTCGGGIGCNQFVFKKIA